MGDADWLLRVPTGVDLHLPDGRACMILSVDYDRAIARVLWLYPKSEHADVPANTLRGLSVAVCPGCNQIAKTTIDRRVMRHRTKSSASEDWRHECWHADCYNKRNETGESLQFVVRKD